MRIVIPSLSRSELICGLLKSIQTHSPRIPIDIFIIETEYEDYEKTVMKYPELNISLVAGKLGLVNQRNFIRDFYPEGEELIISDDDAIIKSDIHECSKKIFENMRNHKILLTGISPTDNPYFNRNRYTQDWTNIVSWTKGLYFCYGCFYWEINNKDPKLYLDLKNDELEDYHRSMQHYLFSGSVARYWPIIVKHDMFKPGGMQTNLDYPGRIQNHNLAVGDFYARYKLFCYTKSRNHIDQIVFKSIYHSPIFRDCIPGSVKNGTYCDVGLRIKTDFVALNTIKYLYDTNGNKLIGIVIPEIFNFIPRPTPEAIELLRVASNKKNLNRGDIAGIINTEKLPDFAKKHLEEKDYHLNEAGTRILFKKGDGFDMSNLFRSYTLGYTTRKSGIGKLSSFDRKNTDRINTHLAQFFQDISYLYKGFYLSLYHNTYEPPVNKYLDTEFTAVTVNNGGRAAIHTDKYNRNFCAQIVLNNSKGAEYTGGDLIFPDYNLVIPNIQDNPALVIFDSANVRHCVGEIEKVNPDDTREPSRMSLVFFQK